MFRTSDMHHIQRTIITQLATSSPRRFSELQPKHVPNNTFSYHLKKLLELGYIESTTTGYIPTCKALKSLPYGEDNREKRRTHTPVTLTMIYVEQADGSILAIERLGQPFQHWYGIPSGIIHAKETLEQAARRELFEKTGIIAETSSLTPHGVLDFQYVEQHTDDVFVHGIGFIYSYHYDGDGSEIAPHTRWTTPDDPLLLPEVDAIQSLIAHQSITFQSIILREPS